MAGGWAFGRSAPAEMITTGAGGKNSARINNTWLYSGLGYIHIKAGTAKAGCMSEAGLVRGWCCNVRRAHGHETPVAPRAFGERKSLGT